MTQLLLSPTSDPEKLYRRAIAMIERAINGLGLIPAAPGNSNYGRWFWTRDGLMIALAMMECGRYDLTTRIFRGTMWCHQNQEYKIRYRIKEGRPDNEHLCRCLHPVWNVHTGQEVDDLQWPFMQNDAIGLLLHTAALMHERSVCPIGRHDIKLLNLIVRYLLAIECWKEDSSFWEEGPYVNQPSLASCMMGFRSAHRAFGFPRPRTAMRNCKAALEELGTQHSPGRPVDGSQLFMVCPLNFTRDLALVQRVDKELSVYGGVMRYKGDEYEAGSRSPGWKLLQLALGNAYFELGQYDDAVRCLWLADRYIELFGGAGESIIPHEVKEGEQAVRSDFMACPHIPLYWTLAQWAVLRKRLRQHFGYWV